MRNAETGVTDARNSLENAHNDASRRAEIFGYSLATATIATGFAAHACDRGGPTCARAIIAASSAWAMNHLALAFWDASIIRLDGALNNLTNDVSMLDAAERNFLACADRNKNTKPGCPCI